MDPLIGGALISAGGSVLQNIMGQRAAGKQMAFQEQMSSSAYQRAMADMKKAGLNPILAYKMGGASTPAGSTYTPSNIGASAVQGYQQMAGAQQVKTQTSIDQRTLSMLEKENLSMPQIQYTVRNVLGSKMLNTFEMAFDGRVDELTGPYKELGNMIQEYMRKSNAINYGVGDNKDKLRLTNDGFRNLMKFTISNAIDLGIDITGSVTQDTWNEFINWIWGVDNGKN